MKKVAIVAIVAAILFLLWGTLLLVILPSLPDVEPSDLVGTYMGSYYGVMKLTADRRKGIYEGGTHALNLNTDGTYTYVYDPVDGNCVITAGLWEFEDWDHDPKILLHNFLLAPSRKKGEKPGYHYLNINQTLFGPIRLNINSDFSYYWIKQKKRDPLE